MTSLGVVGISTKTNYHFTVAHSNIFKKGPKMKE